MIRDGSHEYIEFTVSGSTDSLKELVNNEKWWYRNVQYPSYQIEILFKNLRYNSDHKRVEGDVLAIEIVKIRQFDDEGGYPVAVLQRARAYFDFLWTQSRSKCRTPLPLGERTSIKQRVTPAALFTPPSCFFSLERTDAVARALMFILFPMTMFLKWTAGTNGVSCLAEFASMQY